MDSPICSRLVAWITESVVSGLEQAVTGASGAFSRLRIYPWRYERKAGLGIVIILFAPIKQTALPYYNKNPFFHEFCEISYFFCTI